jgi:hypothetical protein
VISGGSMAIGSGCLERRRVSVRLMGTSEGVRSFSLEAAERMGDGRQTTALFFRVFIGSTRVNGGVCLA